MKLKPSKTNNANKEYWNKIDKAYKENLADREKQ